MKYNKEYFSTSEIQGVHETIKVQQGISWPITSYFKYIVSKKLLRNFKVTVDDISRVELIYGSPTPILQGKRDMVKPKGAKTEIVPLPLPIFQHNKYLHLYIELFFVNGYPFIAKKVEFCHCVTMHSKDN